MNSTREILTTARALIERGWTQATCARNSHGSTVPPGSADASCWCVYGALYACAAPPNALSDVCTAFRLAIDMQEIPEWNDAPGRTKEDVLRAFDQALASLPVEER